MMIVEREFSLHAEDLMRANEEVKELNFVGGRGNRRDCGDCRERGGGMEETVEGERSGKRTQEREKGRL